MDCLTVIDMNYFFTSDTHFGHRAIRLLCNRPYNSWEEHDEALIANWNAKVGKLDIVYFLGDFAFKCSQSYANSIFERLHGIKHLIVGNHEKRGLNLPWASVEKYNEINLNGIPIVLCHYPLMTWNGVRRGAWMLYGHVHGHLKNSGKSLDVGVDCWNYTPVSLEELTQVMKNRESAPPLRANML